MRSPDERLRSAIEAWRRDEARERVWRWRGSPDALPAEAVFEKHAWLGGIGARDALAEASRLGLLSQAEHGAIASHLARAAEERELAAARTLLRRTRSARGEIDGRSFTLDALVREAIGTSTGRRRAELAGAIERIFDARLGELLDARARADEARGPRPSRRDGVVGAVARRASTPAGAPHSLLILPPGLGGAVSGADVMAEPDPDEPPDALMGLARELLERTDGIVEERHAAGGDAGWLDRVVTLASGDEAAVVPRRDRWRRVASIVSALGLEDEIATRVRTEHHHGSLSPRAALAAVTVPTEIRIAESPIELGLLSEIAACDTFGRAVALALGSPALPVELRRPTRATVARAFGALFAQLLGDGVYHRRARSREGSGERLARRAAACIVVGARVDAAAFLAHATGETSGERVEAGRELLRRALGVPVPEFVAALACALPAEPEARLRGTMGGLAASVGLRNRFDEDWFRNPRADEPLRAAAAQGGLLSAERWCAEELRVSSGAAIDRLIEIGG